MSETKKIYSIYLVESKEALEIEVPPEPEPKTKAEKQMKAIGFKKADQKTTNMVTGAVIGCVAIVMTLAVIVSLDLLTLKRDLRLLKKNLRHLKKVCRQKCREKFLSKR